MDCNANGLVGNILRAIEAHKTWKKRLDDAINSRSSLISVAEASSDCVCEFGKWLYGHDITEDVKASATYREVCDLHTQFHKQAGIVISGATGASYYRMEQIVNDITTYDNISIALISLLEKWRANIAAGASIP